MSPNTQYKIEITIGYGQLKPIIEWCERNCKDDWGYDCRITPGSDGGLYDFYFGTESDYINFMLWKK